MNGASSCPSSTQSELLKSTSFSPTNARRFRGRSARHYRTASRSVPRHLGQGRGIDRSPASDAASSLAPNAVRARATVAEFIGSSPTGITAGVNQEVWFLGTSSNRVDGTVVPRQEGRRFHSAGLVSSFRFCLQMRTWKPGDRIFAKERQSA
jgi:hypothetical protein